MVNQYPPGYGAPPQGMPPAPDAPPPPAIRKEQSTVFLISLFLGQLGADRFYLGQTGRTAIQRTSARSWARPSRARPPRSS